MAKREYTDEEYYEMVDELLNSDGAVTDAALRISEAVLEKYIRARCFDDRLLRSNQHYQEIMQKIRAKVAKKILNGYVKREGPDGPVNPDIDGLGSWLRTLGFRTLLDHKKKLTRDLTKKNKFLENDAWYYFGLLRQTERTPEGALNILKKCFSTVANMSTAPYKSLTWLIHSYLMIDAGATKRDANIILIRTFQDRPLASMRNKAIQLFVKDSKYSWLGLTGESFAKIDTRLRKKQDDGTAFGETLFRNCFMQKGPVSSVSDWINKINNRIRQVIENETSEH